MAETITRLEQLLQQLSPGLHQEVYEFVRSLLHKRNEPKSLPAKLKWRGALRELRDQFTLVELQNSAYETGANRGALASLL
ncbi:MAG TPA: DUF2281 domain-containing protein [Phycisphaerae bacterium]|nr:DUF2281 domain-containing protein [Phycisphaerae bacterium]